jgi:hypothetical protein
MSASPHRDFSPDRSSLRPSPSFRLAVSAALCAILGGCGGQGAKDDTGERDTSAPTSDSCSDDACPYDQFCYHDACTPVDGRSFTVSFPYGVDSDVDTPRSYKVLVDNGEGYCDTEPQDDPVEEFETTCDWVVDLDEPYLKVKLYASYEGSTWSVELSEEYTGTDDIVGLIRDGGGDLSGTTEFYHNEVEVEFVVSPDF